MVVKKKKGAIRWTNRKLILKKPRRPSRIHPPTNPPPHKNPLGSKGKGKTEHKLIPRGGEKKGGGGKRRESASTHWPKRVRRFALGEKSTSTAKRTMKGRRGTEVLGTLPSPVRPDNDMKSIGEWKGPETGGGKKN